ncbi:dTDP-4-dehydrorhamnose 3,5-epimerase [Lacibacterium aquatile]|uniref:dTDP-4-dehydrorhamnose 3,5-epimerase n=1 Tax=Lacibacterium aquatile TaxID=1168082 RepID=A0ABW5DSE9_9PROT
MRCETLAIPDAKLLVPNRHGDERGYFVESYNRNTLAAAGITDDFVQDDESLSTSAGTVRGMHCQIDPMQQAKLVRVLRGRILDIIVDLRVGSPSFGRHVAVELTAEKGEQLYVPRGFAHGFCTLTQETVVFYKKTAFWNLDLEVGVRWNDPALALPWPVTETEAIVSAKDRELPLLADLPQHFAFEQVSA